MKHISLILSEGCNLDCSYCYIIDKKSTEKISFDTFKKEFEDIYEENENYIFDIMGGEPLMQMPLVIQFIEYSNSNGFKTNIMTNGLLLAPGIIKIFNDNKVTVSVSHDGIWQSERGKDFHPALIELIRTIDDLKIHAMWNGTMFGLKDNHKLLYNMFGVNPGITIVRDIGIWHKDNIEQAKEDISGLMDYATSTNTIPAFFIHFLTHILRYHKKGYSPKDCGAGDTVLAFHDNKFFSCYRYFDKEDIFNSQVNSETIQDFCKSCSVNQYCEKGCLIQQLENQKPIEYLCEMYVFIYGILVGNINKLNKDLIADLVSWV